MKKFKRVMALVMACIMIFALAACKSGDDAATPDKSGSNTPAAELKYNITVWVPEAAVELTQKQIADFNATNTDGITLNATIEACSEADAATTMITDVESGADIYFFAQDQAARLVQSGALSKLGVKAAELVTSENAAGVVSAAKSGNDLYAYPLTADNGYFMYYDKSVIPEADLGSLEKLVADCEKAGRTFCFELQTSAWYLASFFFGTGCVSEWTTNDDGKFVAVNDTFDSASGLIACRGMYPLITSTCHVSSSETSQFEQAIPAAVVVSGTWNYNNALDILGDNMGAAELPSFTVDGKSYHLGSYNGCKLLGVKPQTDAAKSAAIHKLAQYLTSEKAQTERFKALSWGPANTVAQNSPEVQANPALAALLKQAPYSIPQGQINGSWWDYAKVIGTNVKESDGSAAGLQKALDAYRESLEASINVSDDVANAFTVIGAICGTSWDNDFAMVVSSEPGAQYWYSEEPMELKAGQDFQVRQGLSWDVQFGALGADGLSTKNNFVVPADGIYYVKLAFNKSDKTGVVSLEKNSGANGWTVIGAIAGSSWDKDFAMEIQADGKTFVSVDKFELPAGAEFKVRQGLNWDVSYGNGGANYVVADAGTYTISFDSTTGAITLK